MHGEDRQVACDEVDVLFLLLDVRVAAAVVEKVVLRSVFALRVKEYTWSGRRQLWWILTRTTSSPSSSDST